MSKATLSVGQLVTVNPVMSCGECWACQSGQEQWCSQRVVLASRRRSRRLSLTRVAVPGATSCTLPEEMPGKSGALVEPMAVGYHAVRRGQPRPEDRVLVIGGGPIGQACLLAARRLGVKALALSDVSPSRRGSLCSPWCRGRRPVGRRPARGRCRRRLGGPATLVLDAVGLSPTVADAMAPPVLAAGSSWSGWAPASSNSPRTR